MDKQIGAATAVGIAVAGWIGYRAPNCLEAAQDPHRDLPSDSRLRGDQWCRPAIGRHHSAHRRLGSLIRIDPRLPLDCTGVVVSLCEALLR
jgi:hypothetical protein